MIPSLFPDLQDRERAGHEPAAAAAARLRVGRSLVLRGDQQDLAGLAVKRACLRARHRLDRLLHLEVRRAVLLDDGERAVALRAEALRRLWIERRAVAAAADRQ